MYHHNSGGPDYLGMTIMGFCSQYEPSVMRERVSQFVAAGDEVPTVAQVKTVAPFLALSDEAVSNFVAKRKPTGDGEPLAWDDILGDMNGHDLAVFMEGLNYWPEYNDFIHDSSCEWGYVINLDTEKLEVYTGHYAARGYDNYPKVKVTGRYAEKYVDKDGSKKASGGTLIDEIPLSALRELPEPLLRSYATRINRQF